MKIDFHCHTHHSIDSIIKPEQLAKKAIKLGIFPAITDHNTTAAHDELAALHINEESFKFIPGEEIRTDKGDLIGLYINEPISKFTPFLEALDRIREQGGISYLPHMFDKTRYGVAIDKLAKKVDIIEIFNARCPIQKYNNEAKKFAKKYKKSVAAGGDSHFLFEFGRTYVEVEYFDIESPKALLKALKNGKIVGKKAPIFVRGTTRIVKTVKKFFRKH